MRRPPCSAPFLVGVTSRRLTFEGLAKRGLLGFPKRHVAPPPHRGLGLGRPQLGISFGVERLGRGREAVAPDLSLPLLAALADVRHETNYDRITTISRCRILLSYGHIHQVIDFMAEREGFEPPDPCGSTVFKTAAFDHSATSPLGREHTSDSNCVQKTGS